MSSLIQTVKNKNSKEKASWLVVYYNFRGKRANKVYYTILGLLFLSTKHHNGKITGKLKYSLLNQ